MITVLTGGVGGAKLVYGLAQVIPNDELTVIVNTADDIRKHSLLICPDLDTTMYTLAGIANPETGWGIEGDTFNTLSMLEVYGKETWFKLGDKDIATHLVRKELLEEGKSLTEVTTIIANALGIQVTILPMCDDPVETTVQTYEGDITFQEYFVHRHWRDTVRGVKFKGAEQTNLSSQAEAALREVALIIICPSNPVVSIAPFLEIRGVRDLLRSSPAVCIAVSPIVGGKAVNGPAAKLMEGIGREATAYGVAEFYADFLNGFIVDRIDQDQGTRIQSLGLEVLTTNIIMNTPDDKVMLAKEILDFSTTLQKGRENRCLQQW
jgi:LPPG:FO 2-phospho-L-lactate transferase